MSTGEENIPHLPNPPKKLAGRITGLPDHIDGGETLIGNGELKLTSEHPVSVVKYFIAVHVDEWAGATYNTYSYVLTRFLEYCEYADPDDLSELFRVISKDSNSGENGMKTSDWPRYINS